MDLISPTSPTDYKTINVKDAIKIVSIENEILYHGDPNEENRQCFAILARARAVCANTDGNIAEIPRKRKRSCRLRRVTTNEMEEDSGEMVSRRGSIRKTNGTSIDTERVPKPFSRWYNSRFSSVSTRRCKNNPTFLIFSIGSNNDRETRLTELPWIRRFGFYRLK